MKFDQVDSIVTLSSFKVALFDRVKEARPFITAPVILKSSADSPASVLKLKSVSPFPPLLFSGRDDPQFFALRFGNK